MMCPCRDSIFGPLIAGDDEVAFEHMDVEGLAQELFAIGVPHALAGAFSMACRDRSLVSGVAAKWGAVVDAG